jgi:hypothetical protein
MEREERYVNIAPNFIKYGNILVRPILIQSQSNPTILTTFTFFTFFFNGFVNFIHRVNNITDSLNRLIVTAQSKII